ncbi:hypothetical protein CBM2631_A80298 [Cupriavidus taiwanensis]|nr:hypothetical protein CBM2631_A80298 [Cupriavidus taiwanensis]
MMSKHAWRAAAPAKVPRWCTAVAGALKCGLNEPRARSGPCCRHYRRNAYGCAARGQYLRSSGALARYASLRSLGAAGRQSEFTESRKCLMIVAAIEPAQHRDKAGTRLPAPSWGLLHSRGPACFAITLT